MSRQRTWSDEDDRILAEIVNNASSRQTAIELASEQLGKSFNACINRIQALKKKGVEIKAFRTPSRVITEYAKEIGNKLQENPGNISATLRSISARTNIPQSTLSRAWYSRKDQLTDNRGRSMIFFSLMGDKSHPNTKVVRGNGSPRRTKGLWKKLMEHFRH